MNREDVAVLEIVVKECKDMGLKTKIDDYNNCIGMTGGTYLIVSWNK